MPGGVTGRARDRGVIDTSVEMLFGVVVLAVVVLGVVEATAYWHARNVFDEAAVEGARVVAAFDGTCRGAEVAATAIVERMASGWSDAVRIECVDGDVVRVVVSGTSPGLLFGGLGIRARVVESAPKER